MPLTQVVKREGRINRVPMRESPVLELNLEPDQYIVSVEFEKAWQSAERVTQDWLWTAYVAHRL